MKKAILALAFIMMLPAARCFAEGEAYYIELGGDVSEDTAADQWKELSSKYKQLASLQFFPKTVIEDGKTSSVRMQAGPIPTKEKAQRICNRLFAKKVQCFVIEGLEDAPPTSVVSLSERMKQESNAQADLPWLKNQVPAVVEAPAETAPTEEHHSMWSWLTGKKKKPEEITPIVIGGPPAAPAPVATAANNNKEKEANVEVTEAVHVPLSNGNGTVEPSAPITIKQIDSNKGAASTVAANDNRPGWLIVPGFADDNSALSAWQTIRTAVPQKAAGLRVRVLQPLAHSNTKTSLNIGPFATRNDADAFCHDGVQAADSNLKCHFSDKESVSVIAAASTRAKQVFDPSKPSKQYWAQIIAAPSQSEALEQWQELKTGNADLLKDVRSSISPSQSRKNTYVVRIGPMADNNDALALCGTLQERGIHCSVMLFSGM